MGAQVAKNSQTSEETLNVFKLCSVFQKRVLKCMDSETFNVLSRLMLSLVVMRQRNMCESVPNTQKPEE